MKNKPYPALKIFLAFTLLGGALGGLLFGAYDTLVSDNSSLRLFINTAPGSIILGIKLGTLPALCTAAWLIWRRASRNARGLLHAALAGALASVVFAGLAITLMLHGNIKIWGLASLFMAPTGTASSLILAAIFLPKKVRP